MHVIADLDQKMAAFDELGPELRALIDYGPLNPDSVFAAQVMQRDHGASRAAAMLSEQIAEALPNWTPENGSPLGDRAAPNLINRRENRWHTSSLARRTLAKPTPQ